MKNFVKYVSFRGKTAAFRRPMGDSGSRCPAAATGSARSDRETGRVVGKSGPREIRESEGRRKSGCHQSGRQWVGCVTDRRATGRDRCRVGEPRSGGTGVRSRMGDGGVRTGRVRGRHRGQSATRNRDWSGGTTACRRRDRFRGQSGSRRRPWVSLDRGSPRSRPVRPGAAPGLRTVWNRRGCRFRPAAANGIAGCCRAGPCGDVFGRPSLLPRTDVLVRPSTLPRATDPLSVLTQ